MICKCFHLPRQFVKTLALSQSVLVQVINHENHFAKRWAGHAKWQNIKSTKEFKDKQKSAAFQRITQMISAAVKEGGPDIHTNLKLKKLFEDSKKISMPKATFDKAVEKSISQSLEKPYWIVFTGTRGLALGLEVTFAKSNAQYLQSTLGTYTKRIGLKIETNYQNICKERGVIIAEPMPNVDNQYEKALEDAIEAGVDEVFENTDKSLLFECLPQNIDFISQKLSERGYNILSANVELDFQNLIKLDEEEVKTLKTVIEKIQDRFQEVIRASYNIAEQ